MSLPVRHWAARNIKNTHKKHRPHAGVNTMLFFAPVVFASLGFAPAQALTFSAVLGAWLFVIVFFG